ncbi:hypothetical protein ONS95_009163 [Cadophora gregata]|uniref:uncharacterized protein n=1 Tax=Cadophora gregata TaxID=51156 RepID=UPI0026DC1F28|nr:uncharacterized protein ONS95_009163 [Cadophora gregata]KAK0124181.1 hypothetical protein ONS95_009163 [Cadophora gregata]
MFPNSTTTMPTKPKSITLHSSPSLRTIISYLIPSLAHCQVGFSTTSISGFQAMTGFLTTYGHPDPLTPTGYNMGLIPQQLAASFINLGTILGLLLCATPLLQHTLSRRQTLWLASLISILGSGLQLKHSPVSGLYARRIIIGLSNGLFISSANIYTSETAPAHLKHKISSLFPLWFCTGGVLGAVTNNFTQHLQTSWAYKIPLTCHITIPSLLCILVLFTPESPRWLLLHGRGKGEGHLDAARHSLILLRGHGTSLHTLDVEIDKEILEIQEDIGSQRKIKQSQSLLSRYLYLDLWTSHPQHHPHHDRRHTLLCISLFLTNSSSGIWLLLSYGTVVFQLSGVNHPFHASIYNNIANLLGTILGLYLCTKQGIQSSKSMMVLVLVGSFFQAVCMLGVAVPFTIMPDSDLAGVILLICVVVHGFVYSAFSGGLVVAKLCSQIVDPEFRGRVVGLGTGVNHVTAWLIAFTTPYFINTRELNWGPKAAFIWAASNTVTSILLLLFLATETKGCTHKETDKVIQDQDHNLAKDECRELSRLA